MGFDHAQSGQQLGHGLGLHGRPSIGMNRELFGSHLLLVACFTDEPAGKFRAFTVGEQPTDGIPAEDVKNHIQVIPGTCSRPGEQSDIPGPDLARPRSD